MSAACTTETGHIRPHLLTGHERIANAGSACNTRVPSDWAVSVIPLSAYLSSCLSHKLKVFLCHFFPLKCDPALQQLMRYNLAVLGEVLKHVYVSERS